MITDPAGPEAARIAGLAWFLFAVGAAVVILITALVLLVARRRARGGVTAEPDRTGRGGRAMVIGGGVVLPAILLPVAFGVTLWAMRAQPTSGELEIDVVSRQWFWDVRYPNNGAVTANEIHIPVGQRVHLTLRSADVVHSFWVPRLAGKIDLVPGQDNHLTLQADRTGTFRGRCAEFCGLQHTEMRFLVIAEPARTFQRWLEHQARPAMAPRTAQEQKGFEVFQSSCTYCHRIEGTGATGQVGPDLTHLASRTELGSGVYPNTPGHLAAWILDPQSPKPGNRMPPIDLTGEELQQLLAYLETLR